MPRTSEIITVIVEILESPAHLLGCGPDCVCLELRKLPLIAQEIARRLKQATKGGGK